MELLFDTNILISYSKNKDDGLVDFLSSQDHEFYTSVVSLAEFRAGFAKDELILYREFIKAFTPLSLDLNAAELAGEFFYGFKKQGLNVNLRDHFIAATAINRNMTLVTFNKKDFPHKDLKLYPI